MVWLPCARIGWVLTGLLTPPTTTPFVVCLLAGICYLYIKTAERAHTPNKLWEKIKVRAVRDQQQKGIEPRNQGIDRTVGKSCVCVRACC